jgi:hypothetical protein
MKTKIPLRSITIEWSESPFVIDGKSFVSWAAANRELGCGAKPDLGYYKTKFVITWADGEEYAGRYDIGAEDGFLDDHVRRFCEVYSGRRRPGGWSDERWEAFCRHAVDPEIGKLLDRYQIGE